MTDNYNSYNNSSSSRPQYYGIDTPTSEPVRNNTRNNTNTYSRPEENITQKPEVNHAEPVRHAPKTTKKVPSVKGLIAMGTPVLAVLLVIVITVAIISSINRSKIQVKTETIKVGEMQTVSSYRGYLYGDTESGVYYVAFIDDDYAEHGIQISSTGTVTNNANDSVLYLVVNKIKEYSDLDGTDNDSDYYKKLLEKLEADTDKNIVNDEADETTTEYAEETVTSNKHHVIIMSVSKTSDESLSIEPEQYVNVQIDTPQNSGSYSVPTEAIVVKDDLKYILAVSGNKVSQINVSTGDSSGDMTVIESPELTEGMEIVTMAIDTEMASIEDGAKIKIIEED